MNPRRGILLTLPKPNQKRGDMADKNRRLRRKDRRKSEKTLLVPFRRDTDSTCLKNLVKRKKIALIICHIIAQKLIKRFCVSYRGEKKEPLSLPFMKGKGS